MITMFEYTPEEVDLLYSVVEEAVRDRKSINMYRIEHIIRRGDFYLFGSGANGIVFTFEGLKWIEDNRIYICLIQPRIYANKFEPSWIPVITVDERSFQSSGNLTMIKKENRYLDAHTHWVNRGKF